MGLPDKQRYRRRAARIAVALPAKAEEALFESADRFKHVSNTLVLVISIGVGSRGLKDLAPLRPRCGRSSSCGTYLLTDGPSLTLPRDPLTPNT